MHNEVEVVRFVGIEIHELTQRWRVTILSVRILFPRPHLRRDFTSFPAKMSFDS